MKESTPSKKKSASSEKSRPPILDAVAPERDEGESEIRSLLPRSQFISRVLFTVFVGILIWIGYQTLPALILFFASVVLAVVFHGSSRALGRFIPGGRKVCLPLAILLFVGLFAAAIIVLAPNVAGQFKEVLQATSDAYVRFSSTSLGEAILDSADDSGDSSDSVPFSLDASLLGKAAGWATNAVRAVTSLTLIFVVAIFQAANPRSIRQGIVSIFPPNLRPRAGEVVDETANALWRWTIGQGFSMAVIAALSIAVYYSIGLNFALTLGLIAGLFQFIPYLGPALSAIPALIVAFSMSPQMAVWTGVAYAFIQTVEGNFITPVIMKREAYLPPVLTIMSTIVFGLLFGLAGAALATPLIVVLLTLYREVYQKDILGTDIGES